VGRYITSNNPHLECANRTVSDTHKHGSTETAMTVLQSAHEGRRIEVLENVAFNFSIIIIWIVNKQLQKGIDHLLELT
jgi:hypothetical protein